MIARRLDIRADEEAMDAIRLLKAKGYSSSEVSDAVANLCGHDRLNEDGVCRSCGKEVA